MSNSFCFCWPTATLMTEAPRKTEASRDWQFKNIFSSTHKCYLDKRLPGLHAHPHIGSFWRITSSQWLGFSFQTHHVPLFWILAAVTKPVIVATKQYFLSSTPSVQSFILNQLDRILLNLHNYSSLFNCDGIGSNSWAWTQTCRHQILWSQPPIPSLWACSQYLNWISFLYHSIFHFVFSSLHSWVPVCGRWGPLILSESTTYFI